MLFLLFCEKLRCTNSFAIAQGLDLFKLVQFNRRIKNSYRDRLDESTSLKLSVYDNPPKIFKFPLEFATKLETAIGSAKIKSSLLLLRIDIHH